MDAVAALPGETQRCKPGKLQLILIRAELSIRADDILTRQWENMAQGRVFTF
jgi:hypothetical protein